MDHAIAQTPTGSPTDCPSSEIATTDRQPKRIAAAGQLYSSSPPSWSDLLDPRQPEAFLAICSTWCSFQMLLWPGQFDAANGVLTQQLGLYGNERAWAIVGFIAAALKMAGLSARLLPRWCGFAAGLRAAGLFLSIVFWMIVGVSTIVDLPHTILPIALTGLGVAAAFELGQNRDPRETWQ